MDSGQVSREFAKQCKGIIDQGRPDFLDSARLMHDIPIEPSARLHPMLQEASILLEYIVNDIEADTTNEERWDTLVGSINAFLVGRWQPTCWRLIGMYGLWRGGKLAHTYTILVTRRNGVMQCESGNKKLLAAVKEIAASLEACQTDEWFVYNLRLMLPDTHEDLKLLKVNVIEQICDETEPD